MYMTRAFDWQTGNLFFYVYMYTCVCVCVCVGAIVDNTATMS